MANSSEWIAALGGPGPGPAPHWLTARPADAAFIALSPFAQRTTQPEPEPEPVSPPASEPPGAACEICEPNEAERAFEQGYARGHAEGTRAAQAAAELEMRHLRDLRLAFRTFDASAIAALADDLHKTVLSLCDTVIADHAADRQALARRCREAAARLGDAPGAFTLHLNPLDIAALSEGALGEGALGELDVREDPGLERGALRLAGADSEVLDGPEEWRRAIASALGAMARPTAQ